MILNRAHVLLRDDRKDVRVKENGRLSWEIKYKERKGHARIRDISASGMRMETDAEFDLSEECILSFGAPPGEDDYIPRIGRLVWHKKKSFFRDKYLCGVKFVEADEQVLARMRKRVHAGVSRFLRNRRITTTVGLLLCLVFAGLVGYIIWFSGVIYRDVTATNQRMFAASSQQAILTQDYAKLYQVSEVNLAQKTEKLSIASQLIQQERAALVLFSKELEATRALLDQTEAMLINANGRNVELSGEIQALQAKIQAQIARDVSAVAIFNVEVSMSEYRLKLQSIKNEMKRLKKKERVARAAATAQMDEQRLLLGNNGYFIKSGQPVRVDEEKYQNLYADGAQGSTASQVNNEAEINVTFFE